VTVGQPLSGAAAGTTAEVLNLERVSVEVTNRCAKACWFCYNHSRPEGATRWAVEEAGGRPFQSMSCLTACGRSPRFCSVGWDKTVAWCSYTATRAPLRDLTYEGLRAALAGLGLAFCGGTDGK
jgi:hypothetical protein